MLDAYLVLSHEGDDSTEKLREDKDGQYPVQNLQRRFERPVFATSKKVATVEKNIIAIVTSKKSAVPK